MTNILTYTPMIHAQIGTVSNGSTKAYDVSDDIVRFSINLKTDDSSDFSITLKNEKNKYMGVFSPMDKIAIWLTKSEKYQVLAGYIQTVPYFNLNAGEVTITGRDVLFRLQRLYWDPNLEDSYWLVFSQQDNTSQDGGYWKKGVRLLQAVANWPANKISIGQIPDEVIQWATDMYQVRLEDTQGADLVNKIYEMLQTSGPKIGTAASGVAGAADFSGNTNAEIVWNFCLSQGFTKQAAAGVIGNMQQESGVDPAKCQSGGGPGRGLLQWEVGSDRFNSLCQFASQRGADWTDIQSQLLYFVQEAPSQFDAYTGHGVYTYPSGAQAWIAEKMTFDQFKALTDIPWATEAFERVYTRASIPRMEQRVAYAQAAFSQFGGS